MDGYSTHLPFLKQFASGSAVEFGSGKFSTPALLERCSSVMTIEMQSREWLSKVKSNYIEPHYKDKWEGFNCLGAWQFLGLKYPTKIDFGFVDGHAKSRFGCVNFLMRLGCPVIMAHDMNGRSYRWDLVKPSGYRRFDFTKYRNPTAVWIKHSFLNDQKFIEKHKEFLGEMGYLEFL